MPERVVPRLKFTLLVDYVDAYALPHAPKGWESIKLNYHRSDFYFGMVRSFTVPIEYVKDGAYILRRALYGDPKTGRIGAGVNANVQLRVEKYNTTTYNYDVVYQGDNDFSTFQDRGIEAGDTVTIEVMDGGINKAVKAYESTKYTINIPTSGSDVQIIESVPIGLQEKAQFIVQQLSLDANDGCFPILQLVTNEQKATEASVFNQPEVVYSSHPDFSAAGCFFFKATKTGRVRFRNVSITGIIAQPFGGSHDITIAFINQNGVEVNQIVSIVNPSSEQPFSYTNDFSLNVNAGDRLFFYTRSDNASCYAVFGDSSWSMTYDTISPSTNIYAVKATYLYQQLMNKMNGYSPVPVQSHLLQQWDGLLLTSGNAIKPFVVSPIYNTDSVVEGLVYYVYVDSIVYNGVTYNIGQQFTATAVPTFSSLNPDAYVEQYAPAPVIITSFKDFFTSINAVLNAGYGVENNVATLEAKSYYYKYSLPPINLGKVSKFTGGKPSIANLFSGAKYGYTDQSYDQINGSSEFNSLAEVTFPVQRIGKQLDLTCVYRADSTGWELLRVGLNQDAQGSSSTSGNQDIWFAYCIKDGLNWKQEQPDAFLNVTGLNTNLFNLRISPKENLFRHGDYLAGCLYGLNGEYIRFANGYKNVNVSRVSGGKTITENADIAIGDLPSAYFIPFEATITTSEPANMLYMLDMFPTGSVQFAVHSGIKITMYILDCNTDIPLDTPQEISGLYTINNNLLECVR